MTPLMVVQHQYEAQHTAYLGAQLKDVCDGSAVGLQWNPVEKEWDCPCHGSCFDKKGKQLSGPATTDMRPPQIVTD